MTGVLTRREQSRRRRDTQGGEGRVVTRTGRAVIHLHSLGAQEMLEEIRKDPPLEYSERAQPC